MPSEMLVRSEINEALQRAVAALHPDVVHVRYDIGEDWTGERAIFFRVLLTDYASDRKRLPDVTHRVSRKISEEVQPDSFGLQPYFNFRSKSEQESLNEPAWASSDAFS